jgi:hypothetical protein
MDGTETASWMRTSESRMRVDPAYAGPGSVLERDESKRGAHGHG